MPITVQEALQRTIEHREIFPDEMLSIMRRIMSGEVTPVMIAALTVGLRVKKETIGEIAAAAQVMREFATRVEVPDRIMGIRAGGLWCVRKTSRPAGRWRCSLPSMVVLKRCMVLPDGRMGSG